MRGQSSVNPIDSRYDLSMAVFSGGFAFDAFEDALFNLNDCAKTIEETYEAAKKVKIET